MENSNVRAAIGIAVSLAVAAAVAWAASGGSVRVLGWPLFALGVAVAFVIQWVVFVPSFLARTEHYFDLTGGVTYVSVVVATLLLAPAPDARAWLLGACVVVWALRLSIFLFRRIRQDGSDSRFDERKHDAMQFLMTWTLQGLWVSLTLSAALAAMTSTARAPLGLLGGVGFAIFAAGFAIEAVADAQKRRFKRDPANEGRYIDTGLWAWSRHPNYFGEITLWVGIALIALPALRGGQWVTLISPVFVYVLLTRISGIPMLEAKAKRRWGDDPGYRAYRERTPVLMLRPPKTA